MNRLKIWITTIILVVPLCVIYPFDANTHWISSPFSQSSENTWIGFRKVFLTDSVPTSAIAAIAVDSKYWLWINDSLVVFEGGLKRGPAPGDTYYDEVQIAPFLKKGVNTIALKLWYFGKDGFSHSSSGRAGLLFECKTPFFNVNSDKTWKTSMLNAYQTCGKPYPNYRLSESSILYDSRMSLGKWNLATFKDDAWQPALELGKAGDTPWNSLHKRSIPLFKFSRLLDYLSVDKIDSGSESDTIICQLPANIQLTPYLKINSQKSGQKILICTDNYLKYNGGAEILRAEYITDKGVQEFESPGWMNGHQVYYIVPKGLEIIELKYRESGYDAEFSGSFDCPDAFFNTLWKKSARTLYLTMRDQFMDCPDRERAQWTGDAVLESGQSFYVMSNSANQLSAKWLDEFFGWQKDNGSLFSPSPAGNWNAELPAQSLATIGYYGLWNYYFYSGDKERIVSHYDRAVRYLKLWEPDSNNMVQVRQGDWNWGDWGDNKDMKLLYNLWYYLAVKGVSSMAEEMGKAQDKEQFAAWMEQFKSSFNTLYWNGESYRDPMYRGKTDDRVHALAVVAGIAEKEMYPAILKVFNTEEHASPYMEKYVFEAMVKMGYVDEAMNRHKKRFSFMVNHPDFTTLFEGWGIGNEGFGGGTVNHAWSGGGLTVLMQHIAGIKPASPGFKEVLIEPTPGSLRWINCKVPHPDGDITCKFKFNGKRVYVEVSLPTNVTGTFKWRGRVVKIKGGLQTIKM